MLIDTDILIDYLRGRKEAIKFIEVGLSDNTYHLSIVTLAELYAGVREGSERTILDQFLQEFQITLINVDLAKKGGLFRRDYGKSHGVGRQGRHRVRLQRHRGR